MDITLKNVPETISEKDLKEVVSQFIEMRENEKLQPPADKVLIAKTTIDTFRTSNALPAKYSSEPVKDDGLITK